MTIRIIEEICIGCGLCTKVCPGNLLYQREDGKSEIMDKRDCWDCAACVKECPVNAIEMYLQPEIGGRGSTLKAKKTDDSIVWIITDNNGEEEVIEVKNKKTFDM
ncbi:MAG: adenylylsulfate reductase, subunit [Methanothermococcus sp.]|jgi:adenylylsulfate reductase subunit B|uniref:Beta-subunit of the PAPS reductase from Methanothermococcus thermolithotrophicus n=1 Tax=Methanothermococcus thermolithotrophicus DSM 2095 TaxID=523845 RepID=A0AA82WPC5_METTL|nr:MULTISPECIES: ferredoxin family protein [Methanothermococcus]MDK2790971.1 adenylylsulfate reductase, subunit [Methanothermococcus sp.]MDK2988204.1 adenylylsulfate reductase, subunit [Methanothermococcus sp.]8A8O_C Chain C, Beta-subunit of the PAPS reductase from Methanothermococcus thermolithotrophicus [Methanothermococcus thermolithotrophicus DSM 2095]8A8O_D Chain D, Beta-subunit of the PAPS reductase from Methanothermococcus thermolithotrophicus [Methanothermococcus thermolithotrophicus DS